MDEAQIVLLSEFMFILKPQIDMKFLGLYWFRLTNFGIQISMLFIQLSTHTNSIEIG